MMIPTVWRTGTIAPRVRSYPVMSVFGELDRLFDDVVASNKNAASCECASFSPKLDIRENEKEFVLSGEFPGMEEKDIQIELKDNVLTLSGEKRYEHEKKEGDRTYHERSYGSFSRKIPFKVEINEDSTSAEMKNGVLTITVPKSERVIRGAKRVSIKTH